MKPQPPRQRFRSKRRNEGPASWLTNRAVTICCLVTLFVIAIMINIGILQSWLPSTSSMKSIIPHKAWDGEGVFSRAKDWWRSGNLPKTAPKVDCGDIFAVPGNGLGNSTRWKHSSYCSRPFDTLVHSGVHALGNSSLECWKTGTSDFRVCAMRNLVFDPSQMALQWKGGEPIEEVAGRPETVEYPNFSKGVFTLSGCEVNPAQRTTLSNFKNHLGQWFRHMRFSPSTLSSWPPPSSPDEATTKNQANAGAGIHSAGKDHRRQAVRDEPVCEAVETRLTYFVTRYEYCNLYHVMTDWFNMVHAEWLLTYGPHQLDVDLQAAPRIIFVDAHAECPVLDEQWGTLMRSADVSYVSSIKQRTCFRNAVFLPAGYAAALNQGLVERTKGGEQKLVVDFRNRLLEMNGIPPKVLDRFGQGWDGAADTPIPAEGDEQQRAASHNPDRVEVAWPDASEPATEGVPRLRVTVISRGDYVAHPRNMEGTSKRKLQNEVELVLSLMALGVDVNVYDLANVPLPQQWKLITEDTDVLLGVHGAGLSHVLFLPSHAGLVEFPSWNSHHFQNWGAWVGLEPSRLLQVTQPSEFIHAYFLADVPQAVFAVAQVMIHQAATPALRLRWQLDHQTLQSNLVVQKKRTNERLNALRRALRTEFEQSGAAVPLSVIEPTPSPRAAVRTLSNPERTSKLKEVLAKRRAKVADQTKMAPVDVPPLSADPPRLDADPHSEPLMAPDVQRRLLQHTGDTKVAGSGGAGLDAGPVDLSDGLHDAEGGKGSDSDPAHRHEPLSNLQAEGRGEGGGSEEEEKEPIPPPPIFGNSDLVNAIAQRTGEIERLQKEFYEQSARLERTNNALLDANGNPRELHIDMPDHIAKLKTMYSYVFDLGLGPIGRFIKSNMPHLEPPQLNLYRADRMSLGEKILELQWRGLLATGVMVRIEEIPNDEEREYRKLLSRPADESSKDLWRYRSKDDVAWDGAGDGSVGPDPLLRGRSRRATVPLADGGPPPPTMGDMDASNGAVGTGPDGHKLCVIVPFKDGSSTLSQGFGREKNLAELVPYLYTHLTRAGRDFVFIVAEQNRDGYFNKGAMFNAGVKLAAKEGCDYYAMHDVDQVPLSEKNTYGYPGTKPRHLCITTTQEGFLQYTTLVGGVLVFTREQYEMVNGFSNCFWGWGREDDDMASRIEHVFGQVDHVSNTIGAYRALPHPRVQGLDKTAQFEANNDYFKLSRESRQRYLASDGLSNLDMTAARHETPIMTEFIKPEDAEAAPEWLPLVKRYLVDFTNSHNLAEAAG